MKQILGYEIGDQRKVVSVEREANLFRVIVGDVVYEVVVIQYHDGKLDFEIDNRRLRVYLARNDSHRYIAMAGEAWSLERVDPEQQRSTARIASEIGSLEATMPGLVLDVSVAEEDWVQRGDTLILLEAMKMELRIASPCAGRVRKIHCEAGQVVQRGQTLVEIEEDSSPA